MKKTRTVLYVIMALAVALLLNGCQDLFNTVTPVTATQQMEAFKGYVEAGNLDSLKGCCLSTASKYSEADATFWSTYFGGSKTFTYTTPTGTTSSVTYNAVTYTFTLQAESTTVYKIASIVRDSDSKTIFN